MEALVLVFVATVVFGVPVAFCLGLAALAFILLSPTLPANILTTIMFGAVDSFPLMAIPFFLIAGDIMGRCGILPRLVDFAEAIVGHFRGGIAHVNIVASMFFAGVTGVALADAAAVGAMLIPSMIRQGYTPPYAAALTSAAAIVGPIIPPSVAMIIYANVYGGGISVGKMFLSGMFPGILIGLSLMLTVYIQSYYRPSIPKAKDSFKIMNVVRTSKGALLGLMVPVIILGGIIGGIFTPTESGAIAVMYGLFVGFFVTKSLTIRDVLDSLLQSSKSSAIVFILLATAKVVSWILVTNQVPQNLAKVFMMNIASPQLFLVASVALMLLLGFVMEGVAIMIMLIPVFAPMAVAYGIDPHFFGLIMVMTVQVALITPPVALGLFIITPIAGCSVMESAREVWIFVGVISLVILLTIFFPDIAMWFPRYLGA
ncbi:MAG: TRAP transporter large permease subunit [Desulfovibrio sp.]|jgi:C4-dicarboxylate transporter DctM subunit|nr:TRAP transporter large permease subunit [Desulfovibrio sp.]